MGGLERCPQCLKSTLDHIEGTFTTLTLRIKIEGRIRLLCRLEKIYCINLCLYGRKIREKKRFVRFRANLKHSSRQLFNFHEKNWPKEVKIRT